MEPAPLTAVALVIQSKTEFTGLPHVVSAVSLFLDNEAGLGSVEMLQWLDEHRRLESIRGLVVKAAARGFIDTVRWLLDRGVKVSDEEEEFIAEIRFAIHTAASSGDLSLAKYLHSRAFITADVESRVLQRDQDQERLRPFRDDYQLWLTVMVPSQAILEASKKGFLDVVQWLYKEFGDDPDLFNNKRSYPSDASNTLIMDEAARNGHLDVLQYLHEVQVAMLSKKRKRSDTRVRAASVPKCTSNAMDGAATNGHLTVVQWLHNNRSEGCSARAMFDAARNGHLEVVEWLFINPPEDVEERTWMFAMGYAAENGHLEVVKYLHRKIESSKDEVNRDALRGNITLDLLQRNTAMDDAASSGNLELVKWLHFNTKVGCTTAAMDQAALSGHVHILKWLHLNRTEGCTEKASEYAADRGNLRVLQWLYSQKPTVCSSKAFDSAAKSGYFEVVLFLHSHYAAQLIIDPSNYIDDKDLRAWVEETNNVQ